MNVPCLPIPFVMLGGVLLGCQAADHRATAERIARICYPGLGKPQKVIVDDHAASDGWTSVNLFFKSGIAFEIRTPATEKGYWWLSLPNELFSDVGQPKQDPLLVARKLSEAITGNADSLAHQWSRSRRSSVNNVSVRPVTVHPYHQGLPIRSGMCGYVEFDDKTGQVVYAAFQTTKENFGGKEAIAPSEILAAYRKAEAKAKKEHLERVERFRKSPRYEQTRRYHWTMGQFGSTRPDLAGRCWSIDHDRATEPALPGLRRAWMVRSPAGIAVLDAETGKLLQFDTEDRDLLPDLKKSPFIDVHKEAARKG